MDEPTIEVKPVDCNDSSRPNFAYQLVVNGWTVWRFWDKGPADLLAELLRKALRI